MCGAGCCVHWSLRRWLPLRAGRPQPRQPSRPNSAQSLKLPRKPASVRHGDAVGRQGDRDRQRRGHHPDRHRAAARAARDRQRRPDSCRGDPAPAPAGASQPDRRNAADPGGQDGEDRGQAGGYRRNVPRVAANVKQTPEQLAAYLEANGSSINSLRRQIEGEIAWQRLQQRQDRKRSTSATTRSRPSSTG